MQQCKLRCRRRRRFEVGELAGTPDPSSQISGEDQAVIGAWNTDLKAVYAYLESLEPIANPYHRRRCLPNSWTG